MVRRFHGGVHPDEGKERTAASAIADFGIPKLVVIPLQQHIGAPAKAQVKPGDVVKKGQLIGQAGGFVSANVHASIGGTVKKVGPWPHPLGVPVESVTIEGSGDESWAAGCNVERDVSAMSPEALRAAILEGGLVGMGGATFPSHVKLSPPPEKPIDTLILNGAECEPMLTADDRVMVEEADKVIRGAQLMLRALGCKRCLVGIENNKPDAIAAMKKATAALPDFTVVPLRVRYPQGGEKQLIYALLGREVPSGGLPLDVGVVVHNVGTCAAADDAVRYRRPLIERVVTVAGACAKAPGNFRVRVGTLISKLIARVGADEAMNKLIAGGPMMGLALPSSDIPVTKGTSGILLMREVIRDATRFPEAKAGSVPNYLACIRCGRCVDACPVSLTPSRLSTLIEKDMLKEAADWQVNDCIECGCCAYICPSRRPIVHQVKYGKAELRRMKAKK